MRPSPEARDSRDPLPLTQPPSRPKPERGRINLSYSYADESGGDGDFLSWLTSLKPRTDKPRAQNLGDRHRPGKLRGQEIGRHGTDPGFAIGRVGHTFSNRMQPGMKLLALSLTNRTRDSTLKLRFIPGTNPPSSAALPRNAPAACSPAPPLLSRYPPASA